MDSSDDFEDDPFAYQPLKRRKVITPSQNRTLKETKRKTTQKAKVKPTKPSESKPTGSRTNKQTPKPKKLQPLSALNDLLNSSELSTKKPAVTSTECPICQLPLKLLSGLVSSTNHLAECAEGSFRVLTPCPEGVDCTSKVLSHYAKYDHSELARHRDLGLMNQTTVHVSPSQLLKSTVQSPSAPKFSSTRIHASQAAVPSTVPAKYISPIKVVRRSSQSPPQPYFKCDICEQTFRSENMFEEHVCAQKENVRTPSPVAEVTPHIRTEHQRKFLREIASDQARRGTETSDPSESLLDNRNRDKRTRDWVNFSKSDIFDENLQHQIENAIHCVDKGTSDNIIEGNSELAGPSGVNNNGRSRELKRKSNYVEVVVDDGGNDMSLEPSQAGDKTNVPVAPNNKSPIKVCAEKDSQELELSLNIDPRIHCTKVRLRVPLKKTDSGNERPVEVSANYTDMKSSPSKQAQITSYFQNKNGGPGSGSSSVFNADNYGVVNLTKAKEDWNKIFSRAKAKGYLAPTPTSDNSQEKINRKEQVKRKCPHYKIIRDTMFAVDAFNYGDVSGAKYYLLSHYHYDHYGGLTKAWKHPIICSSITKRLATTFLKVTESLITTLDPGESRVVGGCELTAVDANHCPGSIMFVIRLTSGDTLLHVGDFRAAHCMEEEPVFWNVKIDKLYLDTTYCRPEYDFPSQSDVITRTVELVGEFVTKKPDAVVMVGAYTVGKERIFKAIAAGLNSKVWGDSKRVKTWTCLDDGDILGRMVEDRKRAQVQVVMNQLVVWPKLGMELDKLGGKWGHVLGVKPTGWTHSRGEGKEKSLAGIRIVTRGQVSLLEVPYSEHSSYSELKRFVQFLRIGSERDIIPTVNMRDRDNMSKMFKQWIEERKALGPDSQ